MLDPQVPLQERCSACAGDKVIVAPHCAECGRDIAADSTWWDSDADQLPCGHALAAFRETRPCTTCKGSGTIAQWITDAEYKARLRRYRNRRRLVIGLILMGAIPLLLALWREPTLLCSQGTIGLLLLILHGAR